ncbi:MAG: zinc ribbon domain-containing protein, partial [Desulfobacterales bacterium]|nr:zinc ribbon domain-containing protein [Desulfobacterales bacterium]
MPIYEYECMKCGEIEELIQKFSDKSLTKCKHCSGKLQRLVSQSSFHLKGTGWYVTDYASKSKDSCTSQK